MPFSFSPMPSIFHASLSLSPADLRHEADAAAAQRRTMLCHFFDPATRVAAMPPRRRRGARRDERAGARASEAARPFDG